MIRMLALAAVAATLVSACSGEQGDDRSDRRDWVTVVDRVGIGGEASGRVVPCGREVVGRVPRDEVR